MPKPARSGEFNVEGRVLPHISDFTLDRSRRILGVSVTTIVIGRAKRHQLNGSLRAKLLDFVPVRSR
jgi:hypothetical protein